MEDYRPFEEYKGKTIYMQLGLEPPKPMGHGEGHSDEWSQMSDYDAMGMAPGNEEYDIDMYDANQNGSRVDSDGTTDNASDQTTTEAIQDNMNTVKTRDPARCISTMKPETHENVIGGAMSRWKWNRRARTCKMAS